MSISISKIYAIYPTTLKIISQIYIHNYSYYQYTIRPQITSNLQCNFQSGQNYTLILHRQLYNLCLQIQIMREQNIYFERQGYLSLYCGLHTVNNLLGSEAYDKNGMNQICYQLSDDFINPHKHIFGGDYDVNVLMIALKSRRCECKWFDRRNKSFQIKEIREGKQLMGFMVNKFIEPTFNVVHKIFKISNRHWIAVRRINDSYFFMDSKEDVLEMTKKQMQQLLQSLLDQSDNEQERTEIIQVYLQSNQIK